MGEATHRWRELFVAPKNMKDKLKWLGELLGIIFIMFFIVVGGLTELFGRNLATLVFTAFIVFAVMFAVYIYANRHKGNTKQKEQTPRGGEMLLRGLNKHLSRQKELEK